MGLACYCNFGFTKVVPTRDPPLIDFCGLKKTRPWPRYSMLVLGIGPDPSVLDTCGVFRFQNPKEAFALEEDLN